VWVSLLHPNPHPPKIVEFKKHEATQHREIEFEDAFVNEQVCVDKENAR
jgi:hypothetical protein